MYSHINNRCDDSSAKVYSQLESEVAVLSSDADPGLLTDGQRRAIDALYQAFNHGKPDLLDNVLTDDWRDVPLAPGQKPGRDGVKPMIAAFRAAFAEVAFTPQEVVGGDGRAAVRLVLSGRHIGDWMGVPATGRTFEIAMHELHHFDGDRISATWHVEDWSAWRSQINASGQTAE